MTLPTAARWLAARDGMAHYRATRQTRTACGLPPIAPRFAWPELTRCETCVRVVTAETGDLRALPIPSPGSRSLERDPTRRSHSSAPPSGAAASNGPGDSSTHF
jgi:hypothetical protein